MERVDIPPQEDFLIPKNAHDQHLDLKAVIRFWKRCDSHVCYVCGVTTRKDKTSDVIAASCSHSFHKKCIGSFPGSQYCLRCNVIIERCTDSDLLWLTRAQIMNHVETAFQELKDKDLALSAIWVISAWRMNAIWFISALRMFAIWFVILAALMACCLVSLRQTSEHWRTLMPISHDWIYGCVIASMGALWMASDPRKWLANLSVRWRLCEMGIIGKNPRFKQ